MQHDAFRIVLQCNFKGKEFLNYVIAGNKENMLASASKLPL